MSENQRERDRKRYRERSSSRERSRYREKSRERYRERSSSPRRNERQNERERNYDYERRYSPEKSRYDDKNYREKDEKYYESKSTSKGTSYKEIDQASRNNSKPTETKKEIERKPNNPASDESENEDQSKRQDSNEVDPLEAFMSGIDAEMEQLSRGQIKTESNLGIEINQDEEETEIRKAVVIEQLDPLAILNQNSKPKRKEISLAPGSMDLGKIEPFRKSFYIETQEIAKLTDEQIKIMRMEMDNVRIRGLECPKPVKKWSQCGLSLKMLEIIKHLGYESPTPIQAQAIPAIMSGRDMIGVAKTGSGKTMAFLLPMFRHVLDQRKLNSMEGPIAVILTPTRELAVQTVLECRKFSKHLGLRSVCAYGGSDIKDQIADLKRGAEIIVSTPGRLTDLLCANGGKVTNLKRVTFIVLDEADRMFDMGFEPQVMSIIGNTRPDRQTVLFSATFPRQMEGLAKSILTRPLEIIVGGRSVVCNDITQFVYIVEEEDKFIKLLAILGQYHGISARRVLIFVDKQDLADSLFKDLLRRGYPCMSLHGGKDQTDRECTISDFKKGVVTILIATSVAARGLDVKELDLVVNYECPNHLEDYVHRVGRTGRAGQKGTAITLITPEQERYSVDLVKALKDSKSEIPQDLLKMADAFYEKVKSGQAKKPGSGYRGKGLDKIEQVRELAKQTIQSSLTKEQEDIELDPTTGLKKEANASVQVKETAQAPANPLLKAAQEAASRIAEQVASSSTPVTDVVKEINSRFKVVTPKSLLDSILPFTTTDGKTGFCSEIEINEYSQAARWKITSRDTINKLADQTKCGLMVKGSFYPPNKPVANGDRKLYIRIEGESEKEVEGARAQIKNMILVFTMEASRNGFDKTSKYAVT